MIMSNGLPSEYYIQMELLIDAIKKFEESHEKRNDRLRHFYFMQARKIIRSMAAMDDGKGIQ
jgi:hypothetical protein